AVSRRQRVMWSRAGGGDLPILERYLGGPRYDDAVRLSLFRKTSRQIFPERLDLISRQLSPLIDHHPKHGVPAVWRVARAHAAQQGMTAVTVGLSQFLAGPIGQPLAHRGKPGAEQCCRQDGA